MGSGSKSRHGTGHTYYVMLACATIILLFAFIFLAVSFGTDYWVVTDVDRDRLEDLANRPGNPSAMFITNSLENNPAFYSRRRGLFRTCYAGNPIFLDDPLYPRYDDVTDTNCLLERGYEVDGEDKRVQGDDDYDTRIHLMRAHVAFYVIALIILIICIILSMVGCWRYRTYPLRAAALMALLAMFFTAAGIAFFHGYEYLEKEKINKPGFPAQDLQINVLDDNSDSNYDYSYFLGWISVGFSLIAGILLICVAWGIYIHKDYDEYNDRKSPYYPQYGGAGYIGQQNAGVTVISPESLYGGVGAVAPMGMGAAPQPMVLAQPPIQQPAPYVMAEAAYGQYGVPAQQPVVYGQYGVY